MMQAFRESVDPATVRVKSLEARLAQESQRCLQLEKQVQDLRENVEQAGARIHKLEARLADNAERVLQLEKQMQSLCDRTADAAFPYEAKTPALQLMPELPRKGSKTTRKKG